MYRVEFSPEAVEHPEGLTARQRATVLEAIEANLIYEPTLERRNRKLMRPNPLAIWELRVQQLRVYYDMEEEETVAIRAVGVKKRSRIFIGGEEMKL